jgi:hypothetical protein
VKGWFSLAKELISYDAQVTKSEVNEAHERREQIKHSLGTATLGFLEAGRLLALAVEKRDYKALGYERESDYFASEFGLKHSTAHNLISLWKVYDGQDSHKLAAAGYTRLVQLLPMARNAGGEDKALLIEKAAILPPQAFADEVRELRGQTPSDQCVKHDWKIIKVCRICGLRIVEEQSEKTW